MYRVRISRKGVYCLTATQKNSLNNSINQKMQIMNLKVTHTDYLFQVF